ncbi:M16 family metallopeptidase, partial [Bacteroidota bacterium]
ISPNIFERDRNDLNIYKPEYKKISKKTYQAHCIIGNIAYNIKSKDRAGLILLNNLLGGPGFNSRLNLVIREKYGYAYNVESIYHPYSDTGMFCIYLGLDKNNLDNALKMIFKEFESLRKKRLTDNQLKSAKKQLVGQIAINSENRENRMISNGKKYLIFNKIESFDKIKQRIEGISSDDIQRIANEILVKDKMSTLIYY